MKKKEKAKSPKCSGMTIAMLKRLMNLQLSESQIAYLARVICHNK